MARWRRAFLRSRSSRSSSCASRCASSRRGGARSRARSASSTSSAAGARQTARARHAGWLGRLRYRQGRFDEAATLHALAAAAPTWRAHRAAALADAASALMEAFRLDDAARYAVEAVLAFAECRLARGYALARFISRTLEYRMERALAAEPERVDEAASLGLRELDGLACTTEAAIA